MAVFTIGTRQKTLIIATMAISKEWSISTGQKREARSLKDWREEGETAGIRGGGMEADDGKRRRRANKRSYF